MQEFANSHSLRTGIFDLLSSVDLATDENTKLLDYVIELFNQNGLEFLIKIIVAKFQK